MKIDYNEKKIKSVIEDVTGIKLDNNKIVNVEKNQIDSVLIINDDAGLEFAKIYNLKDFENILLSINKDILLKFSNENKFSKWLKK